VAEGTIFRVPGRGTFAAPGDGRYLRSFGSIDDLMALSLDTELQVVEPLHVFANVVIADQVQPGVGTVMTISFLRLHDGLPFCYTRVHLPMEIGRKLRELPEIAALAEPGARAPFTVIGLMNRVSERPIHSAAQDVTAVAADTDVAHLLGCSPGLPVLRISRLYRDRELTPLELAVNHFHPGRYSYRIQLLTQPSRADSPDEP
jgi:DNA-binding GntR family transcriptional regulator